MFIEMKRLPSCYLWEPLELFSIIETFDVKRLTKARKTTAFIRVFLFENRCQKIKLIQLSFFPLECLKSLDNWLTSPKWLDVVTYNSVPFPNLMLFQILSLGLHLRKFVIYLVIYSHKKNALTKFNTDFTRSFTNFWPGMPWSILS